MFLRFMGTLAGLFLSKDMVPKHLGTQLGSSTLYYSMFLRFLGTLAGLFLSKDMVPKHLGTQLGSSNNYSALSFWEHLLAYFKFTVIRF